MSDSVETFSTEARAFIDRNPGLSETQASMGGLIWGLLRAVYECPNCPGVFREPTSGELKDLSELYCPRCRGIWRHVPEPEPKPKRRKTRGSVDATE